MTTSGSSVRWMGIAVFVGVPWLATYSILVIARIQALPSLVAEKLELLDQAKPVDTIVVGDSRAMRWGGEPFASRGWRSFNLALNGLAAEDVGLQLRYALTLGSIRRCVLGASFEAMTQRFPFEGASYQSEPAFAGAAILGFVGQPPATMPEPAGETRVDRWLRRTILPFHRAQPRLTALLHKWGLKQRIPSYEPDGRASYGSIRTEILRGIYDFKKHRDVDKYWWHPGGTAQYLDTKVLSPNARSLFERILDDLEARRIPTVVVETGRRPEYQARIDQDPLLSALQREWRANFARRSGVCVRFLDATTLDDAYRPEDFFDAVHYFGDTERLVSERIAAEMITAEQTCADKAD